jgi:hypothetical protein
VKSSLPTFRATLWSDCFEGCARSYVLLMLISRGEVICTLLGWFDPDLSQLALAGWSASETAGPTPVQHKTRGVWRILKYQLAPKDVTPKDPSGLPLFCWYTLLCNLLSLLTHCCSFASPSPNPLFNVIYYEHPHSYCHHLQCV